jgi:hypothetical protein
MGSISALGTTYNLSNYGGELIQLSKTSAPFLSMCGGLAPGGVGGGVNDNEFEWQTVDLRASTPNNTVAEGQDAPTLTGRTRSNVSNVVEIHQSAVGVSYTKSAAYNQKAGVNNLQPNPVTNELAYQIQLELLAMKRDINASFLTGTYNKAASTSDENKTRGIITAVSTNVSDAAAGATVSYTTATTGVFTVSSNAPATGDTVVFTSITTNTEIVTDTPYYVTNVSSTTFKVSATKGGSFITFAATGSGSYSKGVAATSGLVDELLQDVYDNGGLTESETFTLWCNSRVNRDLTAAYLADDVGFRNTSRTVGGVSVDTIITDFGTLNVALDPQMPRHKLLVATMSECMPVFLDIPGKGHLFVEALAKTGAQDKVQIYGEVGLKYGAESHHGVLKNLRAF